MSEVCPKSGCGYESSEHGLKVHYGRSEDHEGTIADNYFECEFCGERVYNRVARDNPKFCSNLCSAIHRSGFDTVTEYYHQKVDICENCGVVIEHPPDTSSKFCSRKCSDPNRENPGKKLIEVECSECGSTLERRPSRIERSNNHYCSMECRGGGPYGKNHYIEEVDINVRSGWEKEFILELLERDVEFEYEKRFNLENRVYSPDFIIGDVAVEIKGYGTQEHVDKAEEFMGEVDSYKYVVIQGSGITLPCDEWYSWDNREAFLDEMTGV